MIWLFMCADLNSKHLKEQLSLCICVSECVPQDMLNVYCLSSVCKHPKCKTFTQENDILRKPEKALGGGCVPTPAIIRSS